MSTEPNFSELEHLAVLREEGAEATRPLAIRLADVEDLPPRTDVIEGMVPAGHPTSIHGAGAHLKSLVAMRQSLCVAAGVAFLGCRVTQGAVLYVDYELDEETAARRARLLAHGMGLEAVPAGLLYLNAHRPLLELLDDLRVLIAQHSVVMVVIDSLGVAICGDNQSEEGVIPAMLGLRNLGVACLVIDHQSRLLTGQEYAQKEQFGSVYKGNLSRCVWQVERAEPGLDPSVVALVMRHRKASFGPLRSDLGVRVTFADGSIAMDAVDAASEPSLAGKLPARDRVMRAVTSEPGNTADGLADLTGVPLNTVKNSLTQLRDQRLVKAATTSKREPATWYPTDSGAVRIERPDRDGSRDARPKTGSENLSVQVSRPLNTKRDAQMGSEGDVSRQDDKRDTRLQGHIRDGRDGGLDAALRVFPGASGRTQQ